MDEREGGSHFIILTIALHSTKHAMLPEPEFGETRRVPMALFRPSEISSEIKKTGPDCLGQVDDLNGAEDERIAMREPADFTLRRILSNKSRSQASTTSLQRNHSGILHTFPNYFDINNANWSIFEEANQRFADAACAEAAPGATVWIHDYNLWLAPDTSGISART